LDNVAELKDAENFSRPAETGAGLKSRRISNSMPDKIVVEVSDLDKEFASASRLPGKRGKFLGKGATAVRSLP
jgi:hypothetical protein